MVLRLEYKDKYQLWNDLVRASTSRLFVPCEVEARLWDDIPVEVRVGDVDLPLVIHGLVIGNRMSSRRFPRGVFLRISQRDLEKFRRFLALQPTRDIYGRSRRARRMPLHLPVRYASPRTPQEFHTLNVSETGMFVTCPPGIEPGQQVSLYLVLDDSPLLVEAEAAWASGEQGVAGLHITQISERAAQRLREAIEHHARASAPLRAPILVADDDDSVKLFIATSLSTRGFQVVHCANGDDTLALVREVVPSVVVMDILMPGMDGTEVCKAIRADAELADVRVLFVSALAEDVLHNVAFESGADDYLTKPMRIRDLIELVEHYAGAGEVEPVGEAPVP